MVNFHVKLRYYPGDPLDEINKHDLKKIAKQYNVDISYEKIERREIKNGVMQEDTMKSRIEDITQEVITVTSDQEKNFTDCIQTVYKKYRCPRTVYSLMGSNEAGEKIAKGLMDVYGGWD
jgi:hypothetical protein